jgi:hypothetical protein
MILIAKRLFALFPEGNSLVESCQLRWCRPVRTALYRLSNLGHTFSCPSQWHFGITLLSESAQAAIAKYHRSEGFYNRSQSSQSSGGCKSKTKITIL